MRCNHTYSVSDGSSCRFSTAFPTHPGDVAQPGRAPALQAGSRGFKSHRLHQFCAGRQAVGESGAAVDQVAGYGNCTHQGTGEVSIRTTHFTHQKPRRRER